MDAHFDVVETEVSVAPDGTTRRETRDTGLRNVTLREALEWAYHRYVLSRLQKPYPIHSEQQHVPVATSA